MFIFLTLARVLIKLRFEMLWLSTRANANQEASNSNNGKLNDHYADLIEKEKNTKIEPEEKKRKKQEIRAKKNRKKRKNRSTFQKIGKIGTVRPLQMLLYLNHKTLLKKEHPYDTVTGSDKD